LEQESPAIADKPARRESLPKLLQFDVPATLHGRIQEFLLEGGSVGQMPGQGCSAILSTPNMTTVILCITIQSS